MRNWQSELDQAAGYVRSLIPPPMTGPVSIQHQFIPSNQLGGDVFDYYWLDSDHLAIYLLDVAGPWYSFYFVVCFRAQRGAIAILAGYRFLSAQFGSGWPQ